MCMGILNLAVAEEVGKSGGANLLLWSTMQVELQPMASPLC